MSNENDKNVHAKPITINGRRALQIKPWDAEPTDLVGEEYFLDLRWATMFNAFIQIENYAGVGNIILSQDVLENPDGVGGIDEEIFTQNFVANGVTQVALEAWPLFSRIGIVADGTATADVTLLLILKA